jgi:hypothetical protein
MQEFMLYIRNETDHLKSLSQEQNKAFLKACEVYINKLRDENKLIAAQPLAKEGTIISEDNGKWKNSEINETGELNVGYYHIRANDINDAIRIAKQNPEFEYTTKARVEVRPIKTKETSTGFTYPKGS